MLERLSNPHPPGLLLCVVQKSWYSGVRSVWCVRVGECVDVCVGMCVHYQRVLLKKKQKRSCQLSLYQTAGGAPLKNSKWRLPSIVTEVCVDTSEDSVVSIPVKNRYPPPMCSSPKHSSHPLFSLLSISNPSENLVCFTPKYISHPSTSSHLYCYQCVAVTISSDSDQASSMVSLLAPLLPQSFLYIAVKAIVKKCGSYAPFPLTANLTEAHVQNGICTNLDHRVSMMNRPLSTGSYLDSPHR